MNLFKSTAFKNTDFHYYIMCGHVPRLPEHALKY